MDDDDDEDDLQRFRRRRVHDADVGISGTMRYNTLTAGERDRQIVTLYQRGYTQQQIAAAIGWTQQGVSAALKRIKAGRPGRDARG
jgi:hypothetical protein